MQAKAHINVNAISQNDFLDHGLHYKCPTEFLQEEVLTFFSSFKYWPVAGKRMAYTPERNTRNNAAKIGQSKAGRKRERYRAKLEKLNSQQNKTKS